MYLRSIAIALLCLFGPFCSAQNAGGGVVPGSQMGDQIENVRDVQAFCQTTEGEANLKIEGIAYRTDSNLDAKESASLSAEAIPPFWMGVLLSAPGVYLVNKQTDDRLATRTAATGAAVGAIIIGAICFGILANIR